ncbi:MAG: pyridoxal phosphate-dependent decarboxylase family protein [Pyrinomonadaceae bacterium]
MSDTKRSDGARKSSLDISGEAMRELSSEVTQLVTEYFDRIPNLPVFPQTFGGSTTKKISARLSLEGEPLKKLIADSQSIINDSRHNGHPRFFGYVASPATPAGAFADLIASALNPNVVAWRSAPAATEVERIVVRWLGSLIGYGEAAHGLLTSGGSMANMIALLMAQRLKSNDDIAGKGLWNSSSPMTIYASDQVHMSIPKAADVLGHGRDQVRLVKSDHRFRMDTQRLRAEIEQDLQSGLRPFCIVASAGTVNTGAVDPLTDIANVAEQFGLWFHVDGAYGAPAAMDERKRDLFAGLDRADSVSLDAHKWLYVPIDAGCLLFRKETGARAAFSSSDADYIKVLEPEEAGEAFAFWDYGVELSRRFRALKIWFTLQYYGLNRIAQAISEDNSLAQYLAERVVQAEDLELLAPVELSICCFRYVPRDFKDRLESAEQGEGEQLNAELNHLNERIMHAVQRGGDAYLSNATVGGKFALRACITNFRTTESDLDKTLEIIRAAARRENRDREEL